MFRRKIMTPVKRLDIFQGFLLPIFPLNACLKHCYSVKKESFGSCRQRRTATRVQCFQDSGIIPLGSGPAVSPTPALSGAGIVTKAAVL